MTKARGGAAKAQPVPVERRDWRVERLVSLMGENWLGGEWDAERRLVLPLPGGRLTRVLRCAVAGCPSDVHGSSPLCVRHRRQFAASGVGDLDAWAASGEPATFERRHCIDRVCAVTGADGQGCPRPAQGRWRLCPAHNVAWTKRRVKGISFESFLAKAEPRSELGPCVAACCYLGMTHPESGLCEPHFQLWKHAGRPAGRAFGRWSARVRQPVNSRVLSLRGLPELVALELVYAIGCRAEEQVIPEGAPFVKRGAGLRSARFGCSESAWVSRRLHTLEVRMEHDDETPGPEEVPA